MNFSATHSTPAFTLTEDQGSVLSHSGYAEGKTALTDEQRESAILLAGKRVEHLMWKCREYLLAYDISNSLLDKADADSYRCMARESMREMASLIKGRSPAYVAQLERARGID